MSDPYDPPADPPSDPPAEPTPAGQTPNPVEPAPTPTGDPCQAEKDQIASLQNDLATAQQERDQAQGAATQWQGQAEAAKNSADQYKTAFDREVQDHQADAEAAKAQLGALQEKLSQLGGDHPTSPLDTPPSSPADEAEIARLRSELEAAQQGNPQNGQSAAALPTFGEQPAAAFDDPNASAARLQALTGGPLQPGQSREQLAANPRGVDPNSIGSTDNVASVPNGGTVTAPGSDPIPNDAESLEAVQTPDGRTVQARAWTDASGRLHFSKDIQYYPKEYVQALLDAAKIANDAKNNAATQAYNRDKLASDDANAAALRDNNLATQRLQNQGALDRVAAERGAQSATARLEQQKQVAQNYTATQQQAAEMRLKELEIASQNARQAGQLSQQAQIERERAAAQQQVEGMRLAAQAEANRVASATQSALAAQAPRRSGFTAPRYKR